MKKGSTDKSLDMFEVWMAEYIHFLDKIVAAKYIVQTIDEKREVVEAFVLRIFSIWELLVESLLIDCLNRDSTALAKHLNLPLDKNLKRPVCEAIVSGLRFLDFKSVGELRKDAKRILVAKHDPFRHIQKSTATKIDEFRIIRNYLAHYSEAAKRSVRNVYSSYGLKNFREPGDFLLAARGSKGAPRLADYAQAFLDASDQMRVALS